jgi:hypothetical protein
VESAVQQVIRRHVCDGAVVRKKVRDAGFRCVPAVPAAKSHRRQFRFDDRGGHPWIVEVRDDSVARPRPQVREPWSFKLFSSM